MAAHGRLGSAVAVLAAAVMLFSACGKKSHASSGAGGSAALLGSGTAGSVGAVVTDSSGRTLYHLTTEKDGHIVCTGGCASVWPPMLAGSGSVPATVAGLPGRVGTIDRPDGTAQLTYDGLPLYRYSGDSGPGQANGQGIQGVWFAVTPSGTASGTSASPTSSARGYGGY